MKKQIKQIIFTIIFFIILNSIIYILLSKKQSVEAAQSTNITPSMELSNNVEEANIENNVIESNTVENNIQENNNYLEQWELTLVNKENKLPENYQINLEEIEDNYYVDERIIAALQNMLNDARKNSLDPIICSSYRSNQKQTTLYNNKVKSYLNQGYSTAKSEELAANWVSPPGTSEHQTGLAVDIVSKSYQILDEKQETTKTQKWLLENCYNYGFILRYPEEKSDITGISYEPWHYRYVGEEHAKKIKELDVCLEEYIDYLKAEAQV